MARIVIADDTSPYTGRTGQHIALGGTESSVIQLADALARRGHAVTALTRTTERLTHNGVDWAPLSSAVDHAEADLYLPVQHPRLFHLVRKPRRLAVWLIWPVNNLRHYKRVPAMWRYRPLPVVASNWQKAEYSWVLPKRNGPIVILLAVQEDWRNVPPLETPPPPRAIYASMPGRGLPWLWPVWEQHILARVPSAELHMLGIKTFAKPYSADVPDLWVEAMGEAGRARSASMGACEGPAARRHAQRAHAARSWPPVGGVLPCCGGGTGLGVPAVVGTVSLLSERVPMTRPALSATIAGICRSAVRLLTDDTLWRQQHESSQRLQQWLS